jgi:hypothetical protein
MPFSRMKSAVGIWEAFVDTNVIVKVDREPFVEVWFVNQLFKVDL